MPPPSLPRRIERLPDLLVDQIAAGEVVERPANVVKELVENALDAGARSVEVHLARGGIDRIEVVDDGHGIAKEDLPLAVARHATSKLRQWDDLAGLVTYGFRGEALASIASVSDFRLESRTADAPAGTRLVASNGVVTEDGEPVAMPPGTRVVAERLFERLPARRKFLRAPATELALCARMLRELGVAAPGRRLCLVHEGRRVVKLFAEAPLERFREAFGPSFEPLVLEEEADGRRLCGWISPPSHASQRGELWIGINGRPVKHRTLAAAVRNAYARVLGAESEPSGVLLLDLAPHTIDPNAHPQKIEVRCAEADQLFRWVAGVVARALERVVPPPPMARAATTATPSLFDPPAPVCDSELGEGYRLVGRAMGRYLIVEDGRGIAVVDRSALAWRARAETLAQALASRGRLPSQRLLLPLVLSLPQPMADRLERRGRALDRWGFEVTAFGTDVAVHAVPVGVTVENADPLLRILLGEEELDDGRATRRIASHAESEKASDGPLEAEERRQLGSALSAGTAESLEEARWILRLTRPALDDHFSRARSPSGGVFDSSPRKV